MPTITSSEWAASVIDERMPALYSLRVLVG
jgi:hypothetical protein